MEAVMDSDFVRELLQLENADQMKQKIREQRDEILEGIASGHVKPDEKLLKYLAELNIAAGDVEVK
jgi:Arc/MetJ-type ribon-helix-helix transcriptional regulator